VSELTAAPINVRWSESTESSGESTGGVERRKLQETVASDRHQLGFETTARLASTFLSVRHCSTLLTSSQFEPCFIALTS